MAGTSALRRLEVAYSARQGVSGVNVVLLRTPLLRGEVVGCMGGVVSMVAARVVLVAVVTLYARTFRHQH